MPSSSSSSSLSSEVNAQASAELASTLARAMSEHEQTQGQQPTPLAESHLETSAAASDQPPLQAVKADSKPEADKQKSDTEHLASSSSASSSLASSVTAQLSSTAPASADDDWSSWE
jgi:hypothetical protein